MADNDAWDPLKDPEGKDAVVGVGERLTENEWRVLLAAEAGESLREVEGDRLVWLGLAKRDKRGELELTKLAYETLHSAPRTQSNAA